jgi:hypothetical protein
MAFSVLRNSGDGVFGRLPDLIQPFDNPHICFCQFFSQTRLFARSIRQEQRNVFGVRTQEESFLGTNLEIAEHAHSAIDGFVAIADGAESDGLGRAVRWLAFNWGTMIDESCCKQYEPSIDVTARRRRDKGFAFFAKRSYTSPHHLGSVLTGLSVQPAQQLRSCNSEETRIVVTLRDLGGPAFAGIDNLNTSPVPREINRSEKAGRPTTYYKTIQHVAAIPRKVAAYLGDFG